MRKFRKIFRPVIHKNDSALASLNGHSPSPNTSPLKQNSSMINNRLLTGRHEDIFFRVSLFSFSLTRDYEPRTNLCVEKNEFLIAFLLFFYDNQSALFVCFAKWNASNNISICTRKVIPSRLSSNLIEDYETFLLFNGLFSSNFDYRNTIANRKMIMSWNWSNTALVTRISFLLFW